MDIILHWLLIGFCVSGAAYGIFAGIEFFESYIASDEMED
jgi:hypothetical protein